MKQNENNYLKMLKLKRKKLFEQFPGVRRRHQRKVINKNIRIFQNVEKFMEIQTRRESGRRHYIIFCKIEILIIKPVLGNSDRTKNIFISYLMMSAHLC